MFVAKTEINAHRRQLEVGSWSLLSDRWTTKTKNKKKKKEENFFIHFFLLLSSLLHYSRSDDAQAWHWRLKRIGACINSIIPKANKRAKRTQNAIEHLSSGYHWHHHHFHTHSLIKPRPNKYFSFFFFFSSLLHLVGSIRLTLQRCCRRPSQWSGVSPHRSRFFFFFWQSHWTRYYARDWMQCDRVWRMVPWCSVRAWRDFLRFTLPG